jgi:hypothetical protein
VSKYVFFSYRPLAPSLATHSFETADLAIAFGRRLLIAGRYDEIEITSGGLEIARLVTARY